MGLRTDMAAALPEMIEKLGEEATFTPSGGDPVSCHILIDFDVDLQPDGFQATAWQQATVIRASLSEITNVPHQDDVFTYPLGATNYTVQKVIFNDGLTVKVAVTP